VIVKVQPLAGQEGLAGGGGSEAAGFASAAVGQLGAGAVVSTLATGG